MNDAETIGAVIHRLVRDTVGEEVVSIRPVSRAGRDLPDVWKVVTAARALAVKRQVFAPMARDTSHDLLVVETEVTRRLSDAGCSAARVVAASADHDLVVTEWKGDRTLDDVCQDGDAGPVLRADVIDAMCRIEATLNPPGPLGDRCFPGCDPAALRESWVLAAGDVLDALPDLGLGGGSRDLWEELLERTAAAPPTLGTVDYNARNVVVDEAEKPSFLEFSKIGWDWPERRIVQTMTGLGSAREDGRPVCLVDTAVAARYRGACESWRTVPGDDAAALLDAHHLFFHLLMVARLTRQMQAKSAGAWANLGERRESSAAAMKMKLSGDDLVSRLRDSLSI